MRLTSGMKKILFGVMGLAVLGGIGYFAYTHLPTTIPSGGIVCTMDAKQCSDGSFVGRTGPKCEFVCPDGSSSEGNEEIFSITQDTQLNKTISAFDFLVTPISVVQDSRCPTDVQCIQAGTVVVKAKLAGGLGEYTANLELNVPLINEEVSITLINVSPEPLSTHTIGSTEYVFSFEIEKQ